MAIQFVPTDPDRRAAPLLTMTIAVGTRRSSHLQKAAAE